jgi:DNA-binding transcriptional LysR family regulator
MRYTLRHLQYFVAAAETGSIALAAERIHVSPPSISAAVHHLEREFSLQLFVRHHAQGVSLTNHGRHLLREAKSLLRQADMLSGAARELSDQVRGGLSVGCLTTLAPMVLPELCYAFRKRFPDVEITTLEHHQEELIDGLRTARVDAALTYDLQIPDDIEFSPLVDLPPYAMLADDHALAARRSLRLSDLAQQPLILLDLPLSREYFISLFFQDGLTPQIAARSTHMEVIRTMVANGFGYGLANARPRNSVAMDGKNVAVVPLADSYRPMTLGLALLKNLRKTMTIREFERHCREMINRRGVPGMEAPREKRMSKKSMPTSA